MPLFSNFPGVTWSPCVNIFNLINKCLSKKNVCVEDYNVLLNQQENRFVSIECIWVFIKIFTTVKMLLHSCKNISRLLKCPQNRSWKHTRVSFTTSSHTNLQTEANGGKLTQITKNILFNKVNRELFENLVKLISKLE